MKGIAIGIGAGLTIGAITVSLVGGALVGIGDSDASTFDPSEGDSLIGLGDSDGSTFGISDPTLIAGLQGYVNAAFTADVTLVSSKIQKVANHAGAGGTNLDLTDNGNASQRPGYTSGVSYDIGGTAGVGLKSAASAVNQPSTLVAKASATTSASINRYISDSSQSLNGRILYTPSLTNHTMGSDAGGAGIVTGNGVYSSGVPFKVAAVYNNTAGTLWVVGSTPVTGTVGTTNGSGWTLGCAQNLTQEWTGSIYWMALYNVVLTPGQQLALFNGIA